jgi:orotate phosphoribosyltransferase
MTPEEVLQVFRDTRALLSGHFELRSKLHSDQYFQCALVLQHPRIAERLCAALVAGLRERAPTLTPDAVISPALGGLFIGHEVARALDLPHLFAEKQDNRLVFRRGFKIQPGQHLLVAEDVMTRGGRIQETIDIVLARGGMVDGIVVLVDRSGGKVSFPYPVHSLVKMEPVTWEASACPLCQQGVPLDHPGS